MNQSEKLFQEAIKYIPGGVNSPVRAFQSVGLTPKFIEKADGCRVWDVDGNEYIDYVGSWGPMILGHNHPVIRDAVEKSIKDGLSFGAATEKEVVIAQLICETIPSIEMVRMVNSGTEAVMSALRLARGFTGKDKIIKFEGCYHGHTDSMLVQAGSGVMTKGISSSAGVTEGSASDTLTVPYNDIKALKAVFDANPDQVAAVIIEPIAANMGVILPKDGYLNSIRELCDRYQALLIFDEVITGYRIGLDGAQGYFDVTPDLTVLGKIIGGGMPVGAYGGKKEIMEMISPLGDVYQAGTLSGNPVAMAAGIAQLRYLKENPAVYEKIEDLGDMLFQGIIGLKEKYDLKMQINHIKSLGCTFFTVDSVMDYVSAKQSNTEQFARYYAYMIEHGVYLAPSQFEAAFISNAHTDEDIKQTLEIIENYIKTGE